MVKAKLNRAEFDRTWRAYRQVNRRDLAETINTKLFFIARRAVVETPKAKIPRATRQTRAIIGKIINQRRGAKGLKGLYGAEMEKAVDSVLLARRRSIAFLKSGWIPAIKKFEPLVKSQRGAARNDRSAAQVGRAKGEGRPARPGLLVSGVIVNAIGDAAKRGDKHNRALLRFGQPALQKAFDFETASMKEYIERKMQASAKRQGIRTT